MAAERVIICKNQDGKSIRFDELELNPFILMRADGLYLMENEVIINGRTYQGSRPKTRNIVLYVKDKPNFADNRAMLDEVFKEGEIGELTSVNENGESRVIDYVVERMDSDAMPDTRVHTISLQCPYGKFRSNSGATIHIGRWNGLFEFPHQFLAEGEEFGYRSQGTMRTIENKNAVDGVGMTIRVTCNGDVVNPFLRIVETGQTITIGSDVKPFTLTADHVLEIRTRDDDKHIYLYTGEAREEINQYMTEDSDYIQLKRGTNTIGYGAKSGTDYMSIEIKYELEYTRG